MASLSFYATTITVLEKASSLNGVVEDSYNEVHLVVSTGGLTPGMHPTANSAAFLRKTPCLFSCMHGG
jgi:hypothetical protein